MLTDAEILRCVRPMVLVLDEVGTIVQAAGASMSMIGFDAEAIIGTNALEYVSPRHMEPIMFVFAGPGDHVIRDRHAVFPVEMIDNDGQVMLVDCAVERVRQDDTTLWVVTMMPHSLQSASFHALAAYGRGASAQEVAETIAERLSRQWEPGSEIRSFLLADPVGGNFTTVTEPGSAHPNGGLLIGLERHVQEVAPWNDELASSHVSVSLDELPSPIAVAAREAGFVMACVAIGHFDGKRELGLVSFGVHEFAFHGNLEMIMTESVKTLDMALRRQKAEAALRRAAEQDGLTGLSNRRTFASALDKRKATASAVLYIDVDHFKDINDSFGHTVGDEVLIEVGRRIRSICRPGDVIGRLGGDEFAVLLADIEPDQAERIAHRVLERISDPLPAGLGPEHIAASGGLALMSIDDDDDPVKRADLAMLASKRAGRAQLVIA